MPAHHRCCDAELRVSAGVKVQGEEDGVQVKAQHVVRLSCGHRTIHMRHYAGPVLQDIEEATKLQVFISSGKSAEHGNLTGTSSQTSRHS